VDDEFRKYYEEVLTKEYARLLKAFDLPSFIERTYPEASLRPYRDGFRCRAVWRGRDSEPSCFLKFKKEKWTFVDRGAVDDGTKQQTRYGDGRDFLERVVKLSAKDVLATLGGTHHVTPFIYGLKPHHDGKQVNLKDYLRVAKYAYSDANGNTVMLRFRYELFDEHGVRLDKQFPTMRRFEASWVWGLEEGYYQKNKRGQWVKRKEGTWLPRFNAPIYNLAHVGLAKQTGTPVLVVDGEKDADSLTALGYVATNSPYGYGYWEEHHVQSLKGAHLIVLRDNEPGAETLAKLLCARLVAVAASVRGVLNMPEPSKDVTEFLNLSPHHAPQLKVLFDAAPLFVSP
jgi:hypothetical protein